MTGSPKASRPRALRAAGALLDSDMGDIVRGLISTRGRPHMPALQQVSRPTQTLYYDMCRHLFRSVACDYEMPRQNRKIAQPFSNTNRHAVWME